jgi:predicted PhzF superfamily epimerase YddE/YHI9
VGRPGKVTARIAAANGVVRRVQVGGSAVHVGNGEVWLPDS